MSLKRYLLLAGVFALAILFITTAALAKKPPITTDEVIWELTKAEVVEEGELLVTHEGTFLTGRVIECRAKAKKNNTIPEGSFILTLTAFSPHQDMPGQKAGWWYVQGAWTITKKGASPASASARHSPDLISGDLLAELPFNPITEPNNFSALARLRMSPAAGKWSQGEGTFTFNDLFTGELFLKLAIWPDAK